MSNGKLRTCDVNIRQSQTGWYVTGSEEVEGERTPIEEVYEFASRALLFTRLDELIAKTK